MTKFIFAFIIFAGIVYYFNIDVRSFVDKTGIPSWLKTHSISEIFQNTNVATTTTP